MHNIIFPMNDPGKDNTFFTEDTIIGEVGFLKVKYEHGIPVEGDEYDDPTEPDGYERILKTGFRLEPGFDGQGNIIEVSIIKDKN